MTKNKVHSRKHILLALLLAVLLAIPAALQLAPSAATVKLSKTKVTLDVKKSYTLKLKGNKKKVNCVPSRLRF